MMPSKPTTTEVHIAWTIWGRNEEGKEGAEPYAEMGRPQDWGDPIWKYQKFTFQYTAEGHTYIQHVHCWTDIQYSPEEIAGLFAPLIVQIITPGSIAELCGKEYLDMWDMWHHTWGNAPPSYYTTKRHQEALN